MTVEHRWSSRKELNLDVNLHYPPIGQINGHTRNISLEGMFIDLHGVKIPPKSRLEITFNTEKNGATTEHRVPAYVVHETSNGIGLMLQHVGYQEFDALRQMLQTT